MVKPVVAVSDRVQRRLRSRIGLTGQRQKIQRGIEQADPLGFVRYFSSRGFAFDPRLGLRKRYIIKLILVLAGSSGRDRQRLCHGGYWGKTARDRRDRHGNGELAWQTPVVYETEHTLVLRATAGRFERDSSYAP